MAKKLGKGEKLDLILSELSVLRADMKKLLKQGSQSAQADKKRRAAPVPAKKAAKRTTAPRKPAKATAKPVLVEPAKGEPSSPLASRTA